MRGRLHNTDSVNVQENGEMIAATASQPRNDGYMTDK
jgi:hypothetical protein